MSDQVIRVSREERADMEATIYYWRTHAVTATMAWRALGRKSPLTEGEWDRVYTAMGNQVAKWRKP